MNNLQETAEEYNLEIIETTSERNGYPSNTKKALIGFETFDDAKKIADETAGEIISLHKKDGWNFWANQGIAYKPFIVSSDDYGDNYAELGKMTEKEFLESEVAPFVENYTETFEEINICLEYKKEIWEEIEKMDKDEIIITYEGRYSETIQKESTYFYHDTNHQAIAVI